jgi:dTDP-4-amino-4,6-dideoxygalactose transaminase
VAPAGPDLEAFEAEVAAQAGRRHAVALVSGTAALHLALIAAGVGPGDEVIVPTLTFVAGANAVAYVGARPCFLDSEDVSWNLDPALLEAELGRRARSGALPAAVMAVDLYGQCADYARIAPICEQHGIVLVEDSAEALGATHRDGPAGSFGVSAAFSFNGNKIITTSGGGMLVTDDEQIAARVRHLATQAREPVVHYEHRELGFNYRMSNVLAALGRAQLASLGERVERRRAIAGRYREALASIDGVHFAPEAPWGASNHWLTCLTLDPSEAAATRDDVIAALEAHDIEARPVWKPMHRQPIYADAPAVITGVADRVFETGLCLPSGSGLTPEEQDRVIDVVVAKLAR